MKFKDTKYGDLTGQTYDGDIEVGDIGLTSLEGAPKIVNGTFYADVNKLTSLEGGPEVVSGNFYCDRNKLTSLKGAPKSVGRKLNCEHNSNPHLETEWELRKKTLIWMMMK